MSQDNLLAKHQRIRRNTTRQFTKNQKKYHKTIHQQNAKRTKEIMQDNSLVNAKRLEKISQNNLSTKC